MECLVLNCTEKKKKWIKWIFDYKKIRFSISYEGKYDFLKILKYYFHQNNR